MCQIPLRWSTRKTEIPPESQKFIHNTKKTFLFKDSQSSVDPIAAKKTPSNKQEIKGNTVPTKNVFFEARCQIRGGRKTKWGPLTDHILTTL